ncbi:MAG TPA: outer membrane beta-barrel protein [Candidatus Acidoferrales bacterium]|nr:outer membrane beta-barrel protein [Candidatus Acidoferrales bacterium]
MKRLALLCGAMLLFAGLASAQDSPKVEAFGGYSYLRANEGGEGFNFNGGSGSLAYNLTPWLGVVGDFGGYHWSGSGDFAGEDATIVSYLFGPKVALRHGPITPFAQVLFGGAHFSASGEDCDDVRLHREGDGCSSGSFSENGFAMTIGGGVDWNATSHIGIRLIQAEYLLTKLNGEGVGGSNTQNNARISAGVVFRF